MPIAITTESVRPEKLKENAIEIFTTPPARQRLINIVGTEHMRMALQG